MRLALSVDALSPELTGIGRYCWELATRLPGHSALDSVEFFRGHETVRNPAVLLQPPPPPLPKWRRKLQRWGRYVQRHVSTSGEAVPANVVHGPNFMLPDWADGGIITVHDLSVFRHPETHPAARIAAFEAGFQRSLNRAAHIITDCETVREEVVAFAGVSPDAVTAVPLGVDRRFRPARREVLEPVLTRLGLPLGGYGLSISALEPRKRIDRLLAAWRELPQALRRRFPLVVAGASGWRNETLQAQIVAGAAEGWVIPLGFVSEADLPSLYAGASVFAYPSIYEGFGLPPLEAMASGVPTMVANASCLPEVTRGAAMLTDPDDVPGFTAAITRALEDEQWRAQAISAGIHVTSAYTWERCIDRTVNVYRRVFDEMNPEHA